MNITELKNRSPLLFQQLLEIWEASVKETHLLSSEQKIRKIRACHKPHTALCIC